MERSSKWFLSLMVPHPTPVRNCHTNVRATLPANLILLDLFLRVMPGEEHS